jgi:protein ImuA
MLSAKTNIIAQLRKDLLAMGGLKPPTQNRPPVAGMEIFEQHFPNAQFPLGAIHEFSCTRPEDTTVSSAFISGLMSSFLPKKGSIIWITGGHAIYPHSLLDFNICPDNVLFIHPTKEKDAWWCMEEALRCSSVTAVVSEMQQLNFTNARRFQLAVEKTRVTGFILNTKPLHTNATTCVSRWKISSLPSLQDGNLPGVGQPRWLVNLQKIRNGKPGSWEIAWTKGKFNLLQQETAIEIAMQRKTG